MTDLSAVYDGIRKELSELFGGLSKEDLERPVPATPGWTVRDIATHLTADATCTINGDFPKAFFENFGQPDAIAEVNAWTARQIEERRGRSIEDLLAEWEKSSITLTSMMRGETEWPDIVPFGDRVLITDATVHQHDVYGALDKQGDRASAGIKLGSSGYVAMLGFRLTAAEDPKCLKVDAGDKSWIVGGEEPDATVRASRFEFFRALSGRRSPEQIRAYDWTGDPDPFIAYFYPYGLRAEPLYE